MTNTIVYSFAKANREDDDSISMPAQKITFDNVVKTVKIMESIKGSL